MSILNILDELASDASGNVKKAILQREVKNTLLRDVFVAAYNPYISYNIRKIPDYIPKYGTIDLASAIKRLSNLANRKYTGNAGIEYLRSILEEVNPEDAIVIERIIDRDLRCGTSDSTSNKIWPGSVPSFDVLLAHKDTSGIKFPCYGQLKSDGMRCHLHFDGEVATAFTRSGKTVELHGALNASAKKLMKAGQTFDGELVIRRKGKILDRKTGNGILNKGVKNTISVEEANEVCLVVWDIVDFSSTIKYKDRFETLKNQIGIGVAEKIQLIESRIIKNDEEAGDMFVEMRNRREEGIILKNFNGLWVPKRSKDLGKVKAVEEADLKIVDWIEGTGKYEGMLGALVGETSDGLLRVKVGAGYSDEERASITKNIIGGVMSVLYNEIITSKGKDQACLFLPRFVEIRLDKKIANKLSELK